MYHNERLIRKLKQLHGLPPFDKSNIVYSNGGFAWNIEQDYGLRAVKAAMDDVIEPLKQVVETLANSSKSQRLKRGLNDLIDLNEY